MQSLLKASSESHPSVLAVAVWHGRSEVSRRVVLLTTLSLSHTQSHSHIHIHTLAHFHQCLRFLLNAGASPFDCGLAETDIPYDNLESLSPCSNPAPSPPPSLLHLALLGREGDGEGEEGRSVQLLKQLLPLLDCELELTDAQGEGDTTTHTHTHTYRRTHTHHN